MLYVYTREPKCTNCTEWSNRTWRTLEPHHEALTCAIDWCYNTNKPEANDKRCVYFERLLSSYSAYCHYYITLREQALAELTYTHIVRLHWLFVYFVALIYKLGTSSTADRIGSPIARNAFMIRPPPLISSTVNADVIATEHFSLPQAYISDIRQAACRHSHIGQRFELSKCRHNAIWVAMGLFTSNRYVSVHQLHICRLPVMRLNSYCCITIRSTFQIG